MSSNKTHRAFRISDDLWNEFTQITQREGITATAAITRFLQTCIQNGSVQGAVNTVFTVAPPHVSTVDTVAQNDVNTDDNVNTKPHHYVNTSIEIDDVKGLTDVLTTLQQTVNSLLSLRETVLGVREDLEHNQSKVEGLERRFQLETDKVYKQFSGTVRHISQHSEVSEDVPTLTKSESQFVNTNDGIESDNVYTPPGKSEPAASPQDKEDIGVGEDKGEGEDFENFEAKFLDSDFRDDSDFRASEITTPQLHSYNEAQALIRDWVLKQKRSQKEVVEHLNAVGYKTKSGGSKWSATMVSLIVTDIRRRKKS